MEEYILEPYKVYARTDEAGRVVEINSSAFLMNMDGWTEIDQGYGDRFHHAQGNYLPGGLMDERGLYLYKLEDGQVVERTQEEVDADYVPPTSGGGSDDGDLAAQVAALQAQVNEQAKQLAAYEAAYTEGVQSA